MTSIDKLQYIQCSPQQPVQVPFCLFVCKEQPAIQDQPVMVQANIVLMLVTLYGSSPFTLTRITYFLHNSLPTSSKLFLLETFLQLSLTIVECCWCNIGPLFMIYK